jgi:hypothetical protein
MAPPILYPPVQLPPAAALALSQRAPALLKSYPSTTSSSPLSTLLSGSEKSEQWIEYENMIISCLRTGDDEAAYQCLKRLVARFGDDNERIQALKGLVKEAEAKGNGELEEVLQQYNQILGENGTNIVRPGHFPSLSFIEEQVADTGSSLSRRGGSRSCGPWAVFLTQRQLSCSFSTSRLPIPKRGLSCRISTYPRACIHKLSTRPRRSWYWRRMHGMYAVQP